MEPLTVPQEWLPSKDIASAYLRHLDLPPKRASLSCRVVRRRGELLQTATRYADEQLDHLLNAAVLGILQRSNLMEQIKVIEAAGLLQLAALMIRVTDYIHLASLWLRNRIS
jgi:hypothetical protein